MSLKRYSIFTHKVPLAILLGVNLSFANSLLANERLDLLKNISAAGAPLLTLEMLDQAQPGIDQNLYEWILWEQERLDILARWQQWDQLLVRIETLPADIPEQFKQQVATFKARAFLELDQTASARRVLREQLWLDLAQEPANRETWRRAFSASRAMRSRPLRSSPGGTRRNSYCTAPTV